MKEQFQATMQELKEKEENYSLFIFIVFFIINIFIFCEDCKEDINLYILDDTFIKTVIRYYQIYLMWVTVSSLILLFPIICHAVLCYSLIRISVFLVLKNKYKNSEYKLNFSLVIKISFAINLIMIFIYLIVIPHI